MNYTEAEVNKFNNVAPQWWDEDGPLKTLHQVNPIRLKFITNNVKQYLKKDSFKTLKILDVGCGGGILSESLAKLGADVTGIDLSSNAIEVAKLHILSENNNNNTQLNINYLETSIEDFAIHTHRDNQFDIITCMELLEHVPDPSSIINNICKLLKPNGLVFLSTLNRNPKSYLLSIALAEYILNWLPKGTHEYNKFIKPSEMAHLLRQSNLKINSLSGITYSLFTQSFMQTSNIDVNYMVCAVK